MHPFLCTQPYSSTKMASPPVFQVQRVPHRPAPASPALSPALVLRTAKPADVIAAMKRCQSHGTQRASRMPNVTFWAYVSEMYFKERTGVPRAGQEWGLGEAEAGTAAEEGWEEEELEEEMHRRGREAEGILRELRKAVAAKVTGREGVRPAGGVWGSLLHPSPHFAQLVSLFHSLPRRPHACRLEALTRFCEACVDCQSSSDRPIITCFGCGLSVHLDCYGLTCIPSYQWYCESCVILELCTRLPICAVCRKPGGALKKGLTTPIGDTGWAHIFCVESIPEASFLDEGSKEGVDLSHVDPQRCSLHCEFCPVSSGACLQCTFRSCRRAFHPTCWKSAYAQPFASTSQVFVCAQHRDNDDHLSRLERAHTKELQLLVKDLSVSLPASRPRVTASNAELKLLANAAKESLHRHNRHGKKAGFAFVLDRKKRCTEVDAPVEWNVLSPDIFATEGHTIPGLTQAEASQLYTASYSRLVKRLQPSVHEFGQSEATRLRVKMEAAGAKRKRRGDRPTLVTFPLHFLDD